MPSSPATAAKKMSDDAWEEDPPSTQRRTDRKKTKKAKKQTVFKPDEKSQHAYSISTFKNKIMVAGMEAFLSRPEFGIDVATEFPPREVTGTPFYDEFNNPISRAHALAVKCHELHQALIDAYKTAMAEDASRDAVAKRIMGGHRYDLPDAMEPDGHLTGLARINLQTIRERVTASINAAYDNNLVPAAELTDFEIGGNNLPLISAAVQRLIHKIMDAKIRGNRFRVLHVSESGDSRFQTPVEHGQLRFKLRNELESTLVLEAGMDRAAIATKLVVQEFPP